MRLIDLSHDFGAGRGAYTGMPQPIIRDHMTFEQSVGHYDSGTEFSIKLIEMVANTGTYLDTPAHRHRGGYDLAALPLERVTAVPGLLIDATGPAITPPLPLPAAGHAILFRTGWSRHWDTSAYGGGGHPHLTAAMAEALASAGVAVVGIDSHNIDDTSGGSRPAHTILLAAGIPIVEHLTGLEALPTSGFEFYAVPPRVVGMGTFPVRAFAVIREEGTGH